MKKALPTEAVMKKIPFLVFLISMLLGSSAQAECSYKTMAKELAKAGLKHNVHKVAVLPFSSIDGGSSLDGDGVAERLVTELVRSGKVDVVERGLLSKVMGEHNLMATGAIRRDQVKNVGELLAADAIVTGTLFVSGGKLEVHARLIDVGSGRALYASTAKFDSDWAWNVSVPKLEVSVPAFDVPPPSFEVSAPIFMRDAVAGNLEAAHNCGEAAATVEVMQRTTLGLKARYWATKVKEPGFSRSSLTSNPGSEIADPELRAHFYELVKSSYHEDAPRLSQSELKQLLQAEEKAQRLMNTCQS
ncbi:MAG: FlgO family outer membrane protein [Elusimicrobiota bacterium]